MARSKTSYLVPLGIFIALAALLFYGLKLDPRKVPSPLVGRWWVSRCRALSWNPC